MIGASATRDDGRLAWSGALGGQSGGDVADGRIGVVSHQVYSVMWALQRGTDAVDRATGLSSRRDLTWSVRYRCTVLTSFDLSWFELFGVVFCLIHPLVHRLVCRLPFRSPDSILPSFFFFFFPDPLLHRPSFSPSVSHSSGHSVVDPFVRRIAAQSVDFYYRASHFYRSLFVIDLLGFSSFCSTCLNRRLVPCRQFVGHGLSFLDWSNAPTDNFCRSSVLFVFVVFRCSFGRFVTRSIGYRRPSTVLSAIPSLDPLVSFVLFAILSVIPSLNPLVSVVLYGILLAIPSLDPLVSVVLSLFFRPFCRSIRWFPLSFCRYFGLFAVYPVRSSFSSGSSFSSFWWRIRSSTIFIECHFSNLYCRVSPSSLLALSSTSLLSFGENGALIIAGAPFPVLEGSGFFIRGPSMGHVLSLEINFIVPVEVQPGLGPPSYDYVQRAQTFPAGADVSRCTLRPSILIMVETHLQNTDAHVQLARMLGYSTVISQWVHRGFCTYGGVWIFSRSRMVIRRLHFAFGLVQLYLERGF
ncbi:uncharacterized protein G2W53_033172 [Senna tora]|uniref:Uncharacterized protein n=1 Tax=Senna tora TaxID=362788 RepID=A0A834WAS2_9FABA|nr:uncharacterized protein G2W53_033172 [Senna tora]